MRLKVPHSRAYIAALAAAAALVLIVGFLFKPSDSPKEPMASEQERTSLERLLRRQTLTTMSQSLSDAAEGLFPNVARAQEFGSSGVAWSDGSSTFFITAANESRVVHFRPGTDRRITAQALPDIGWELPFSAFRLPAESNLPVSRQARLDQINSGDWLIAVWRDAAGLPYFVPGFYAGMRQARCGNRTVQEIGTSIALGQAMAGAGVFDLSGNLAAIVVRCEDRYLAMGLATVEGATKAAQTQERRVQTRFGARLLDLDQQGVEFFGAKEGLLVSQVALGSAADQSGLLPGDVLVSWKGAPIRTLQDVESQLQTGIDGMLRVLRQKRLLNLRLRDSSPGEVSGILFSSRTEGIPIQSVTTASAAQQAGIVAGDRLLMINGRTVNSEAAARTAFNGASSPAFVVVERDGQRLGVFLSTK